MATLNDAIALAAQAHAGQQDRLGEPYILHPLRMVAGLADDRERIIAALHDVVEKSDWSLDRLVRVGFDSRVVAAVDALSRRDGEEYFDFVRRAISDPDARPVKRADLLDNLASAQRERPSDERDKRIERYERALRILEESFGGSTPATVTARPQAPDSWPRVAGLPARIGARILALQHLRGARVAARRLAAGDDAEALHDFRVALRRLLTLLKTCRTELRGTAGRRGRRAIRDLLRATTATRDTEVRLQLLDRLQTGSATPASAWLRQAWAQDARRSADAASRQVATRFPQVRRRLRRRLSRFRLTRASEEGPPLATALAVAAQRLAEVLRGHLEAARPEPDEQLHRARLTTKRLRYVVEPLGTYGAVAGAVATLTELQDLLGAVRDLSGFQEALTADAAPQDLAPDLQSLWEAAADERAGLLRRLEADCLGGAANTALRPLTDALAGFGGPGGKPSVPDPSASRP